MKDSYWGRFWEAGYRFNLQIGYSNKHDSSYYIYNIQIDLNLRTQKMSEIGQIIGNWIKSWEYVPSDVDVIFDCRNEYGYIYIHVTMPANNNFIFYLIDDWTNDYVSLSDGDTLSCFLLMKWIIPNRFLNLIYLMFIYTEIEIVLHMTMYAKWWLTKKRFTSNNIHLIQWT
jgi:hypothetical protein